MIFDVPTLEIFLNRLAALFEEGMSEMERGRILKTASQLQTDSEESIDLTVKYNGQLAPLKISILVDHPGVADIYFFSHTEVSKAIKREVENMKNGKNEA